MKTKNIWSILLVAVLIIAAGYFSGLFSVLSTTNLNMVQYTGQPSWYDNTVTEPISFSSTAVIDDYKFTIETSDFRSEPVYTAYHCLTEQEIRNKYSYAITLTPTIIDSNKCQLYSVVAKEFYCVDGSALYSDNQCLVQSCGRYNLRGVVPSGCLYNNGDYCTVCPSPALTRDIVKTEGGRERIYLRTDEGPGCWAQHKMYYKNNLVWTSDWKRNTVFTPKLGAYVFDEVSQDYVYDYDYEDASNGKWENLDSSLRQSFVRSKYILADFSVNSYYAYATCKSIMNQYQWQIPANAVNVSVNMPENIIQGQPINVEVVVTNNWKPMAVNLISDFRIPTILSTQSTQHVEEIKNIPIGVSKYYFTLDGSRKFDELFVKTQVDVLYAGNKFSGVNGFCYKGDKSKRPADLSLCDYVLVAQVMDSEYKLTQQNQVITVEKTIEKTVEVPVENIKIVEKIVNNTQTITEKIMNPINIFLIVAVIGLVLFIIFRGKKK